MVVTVTTFLLFSTPRTTSTVVVVSLSTPGEAHSSAKQRVGFDGVVEFVVEFVDGALGSVVELLFGSDVVEFVVEFVVGSVGVVLFVVEFVVGFGVVGSVGVVEFVVELVVELVVGFGVVVRVGAVVVVGVVVVVPFVHTGGFVVKSSPTGSAFGLAAAVFSSSALIT